MSPGRRKAYLAAVASVVVIGGGVVAKACTCVIGSTTGGSAWTPVTQANIEVNASTGSDSCTRTTLSSVPLTSGHVCATWGRANSIASGGDVVAVDGGTTYNSDNFNSVLLTNNLSRTSDVTFACGNTSAVTLNADQLWIDTKHVVVQGQCFNIQNLWIGDPVNEYGGQACSNITVDNVQMFGFDISGPCSTVTVSNSTIGPDIPCYQPGSEAGGTCQNSAYTNEKYFFDRNEPNVNFNEPKVHDGTAGPPQNVVLQGDTFFGMSSRDPDGTWTPDGLHTGCLWIGYGSPGSVTVSNSTFQFCMTYDIHVDTPSTQNITVTGNTFSRPIDGIRNTVISSLADWNAVTKLSSNWTDIQVKCQNNQVLTGMTVTNNTFSANGYDLDYGGCSNATYSGTTVSGNTVPGGAPQNPAQPFSS